MWRMAWTFSLSSDWQEWNRFKLEIRRNNRKLPLQFETNCGSLRLIHNRLYYFLVSLTTTLRVFSVYCKKRNMLHCISCLWLDPAEESGAQLPGRRRASPALHRLHSSGSGGLARPGSRESCCVFISKVLKRD